MLSTCESGIIWTYDYDSGDDDDGDGDGDDPGSATLGTASWQHIHQSQRGSAEEGDPLSIAETYQGMFYPTHLWWFWG